MIHSYSLLSATIHFYFTSLSLPCEIRYYYCCIFQMNKLGLGEFSSLTQGQTAGNWENQNSDPGLFYTRVRVIAHQNNGIHKSQSRSIDWAILT